MQINVILAYVITYALLGQSNLKPDFEDFIGHQQKICDLSGPVTDELQLVKIHETD